MVLNTPMLIAAAILVASYALIFSERLHRTSAALLGAVVMVGVGEMVGFYTQEQAVASIDANTMLLLLGMMLLVALLRPNGGFEYLAIRLAKLSAASPRRLFVYLSLAVSVLSMFLDNVTTVIIFAPLTVLITRMLGLNPAPYLMAEAMLSNIGGVATLVGDPPNIMIGSAAGLDFNAFLIHLVPAVVPVWLGTVVILLVLFRRELHFSGDKHRVLDLDESKAITDPQVLRRVLWAMAVVLGLFFIHHHIGFYPAFAALIGLVIAVALVRPDPEDLLKQAEWPVLFFFASLCLTLRAGRRGGCVRAPGPDRRAVGPPGERPIRAPACRPGANVGGGHPVGNHRQHPLHGHHDPDRSGSPVPRPGGGPPLVGARHRRRSGRQRHPHRRHRQHHLRRGSGALGAARGAYRSGPLVKGRGAGHVCQPGAGEPGLRRSVRDALRRQRRDALKVFRGRVTFRQPVAARSRVNAVLAV